jgi:hypothetical protein
MTCRPGGKSKIEGVVTAFNAGLYANNILNFKQIIDLSRARKMQFPP